MNRDSLDTPTDVLRAMADGILYINRGEPGRLRPLVRAVRDIVEYAAPLVDERIGRGGSDFITVLAEGERRGVFTRHQVLVNTGLLLFAGRTIAKGDRLRWIMAAANRDPRVFADPDIFDIGRQPNPHLSLGSGVHYCLGATLARIEGQEVLRGLAERFRRFELVRDPPEYQPSLQFRSVKSLPVRWPA